MQYLPGAAKMKEADSYTIHTLGVPSLELMERAAKSCVCYMKEKGLDLTRVLIVCGSGNNGGDGFAIGRLLLQEGYQAEIVMAGNVSHCTPECQKQMELFSKVGGRIGKELPVGEYSLVVDAIFGVGLCRQIEGAYARLIEQLNDMDAVKFAVDIPSGISADTGNVLGVAFQADHTVTFQKKKFGMEVYPGKTYCGCVHAADIGISDDTLKDDMDVPCMYSIEDYKALLPNRPADSNKGSFGKVLMVSGSKGMSGAAYFNAKAAYLSGAGLVRIYTAEENRAILQQLLPEAIITTYDTFSEEEYDNLLSWADVVCIGSGLGMSETAEKLIKQTMKDCKVPCVIDADGINLLAKLGYEKTDCLKQAVLTPHMKEMSRIAKTSVEEIKKDRLAVLKEFTEKAGCTCVLKDSRTVIGKRGEHPVLNGSGNQAMAKAGSGDVLAGMITGLMAQGLTARDASVLGVYLHGRCGDFARDEKGSYSVLVEDLLRQISYVMKGLEEKNS